MSTAPSLVASPTRRDASPFAAGSIPLYSFLGVAVALLPLMLMVSGLEIAVLEYGVLAAILGFVAWFAICLRGRGFSRVATVLEGFAIFSAMSTILCLVSFIVATLNRPFVDASLAAADRILLPGFDWRAVMLEFSRLDRTVAVATWCYQSIAWQPQALILALCIGGQFRHVWQFVLSWAITLCVCIAIFALCPALGAYMHFGIPALELPDNLDATPWYEVMYGLRAGTLHYITLPALDGLVTFPSFHAVSAVLLGHAFSKVRLLYWPFVALNIVMFATAIPVGGHYVVDLIAGGIIAVAGICASSKIMDRIYGPDQRRALS